MRSESTATSHIDLGRLNFRLLHYFRVVAEELSFSKAARRLNMSQPPLSSHIKELENTLGAQLFLRTTRSVALTPAGRALLREVESLLDKAGEALEQVRQLGRGEKGHMVLGVVGTAVWGELMSSLKRFVSSAPAVTWSLIELTPFQQIDALHRRQIDLGIWREAHTSRPAGMESQLLERERIVVALSADHPLAGADIVPLAALERDAFILLMPQESSMGGYLYNECRRHGLTPRIEHQVREPQTTMALVGAGYGVSLIPESYARIAWPNVRFCPLDAPMSADLYAIYDPAALTPTVRGYIDMLKRSGDR